MCFVGCKPLPTSDALLCPHCYNWCIITQESSLSYLNPFYIMQPMPLEIVFFDTMHSKSLGGWQMSFETFLSLLVYMSITATTPGPNNILALNSVVNYGYQESKRLILGICAGFASIMIFCGFGCNFLIEFLPDVLGVLKILGVAYVLYLAYKVARSKPQSLETTQSKKLGFSQRVFLAICECQNHFIWHYYTYFLCFTPLS